MEAHTSVGIEALKGPQQRDAGNLEQVVQRLARSLELAGETARERHHLHEELVARAAVVVLARSGQQPALARAPRNAPWRCTRRSVVHGKSAKRVTAAVQQLAPLSQSARRIALPGDGQPHPGAAISSCYRNIGSFACVARVATYVARWPGPRA
jgi:hypothetical protein